METLNDFYRQKAAKGASVSARETGDFNVFKLEDLRLPNAQPMPYSRRDFYKVTLYQGSNVLHYADRSIGISGSTLLFFNPRVPYAWGNPIGPTDTGLFCVFKEGFFHDTSRISLRELPVFSVGGQTTFSLSDEQTAEVKGLFQRMMAERRSDYVHKYDLIRNFVSELFHAALKMQPTEKLHGHQDAKSRITAVFLDLLDRQFPIDSPAQRLTMRSAAQFADQLSVHVNHLNRSLRQTTGKTTTTLIAERIISEAKALLKYTDWNVADIAYCLGFDESSHFNHFFRKHMNQSPTSFRNV